MLRSNQASPFAAMRDSTGPGSISETWTPELGLEFLRSRKGPDTDAAVAFEIDRYLGRPGQAIAYKLGERVWLEAREAARRRAGPAFDLKEFHRRALDLGRLASLRPGERLGLHRLSGRQLGRDPRGVRGGLLGMAEDPVKAGLRSRCHLPGRA